MKMKFISMLAVAGMLSITGLPAQNAIWKFGTNGGLQFNPNGTTSAHSGSSYSGAGAATGISDPDGNLIFYTDGKNLWEANNTVVSTTLPGSLLSTQAPIIVPAPGVCNAYLVFTTTSVLDNTAQAPRIHITIVTVNGSAPPYTVASISSAQLHTQGFDEKIAVVKDNTNNGLWLTIHKFKDPYGTIYPHGKYFFTYNITEAIMTASSNASQLVNTLFNNGIMFTGTLDHAGGVNAANAKGQMKFNKAGTKLALVVSETRQLELYNFNKANGALTYVKHFTLPAATSGASSNLFGLEFSPDGSLLYVSESYHASSGTQKRLFQVNYSPLTPTYTVLDQTNAIVANENTYNALQLGPNDKIYVSGPREGSSSLSVIQNPNVSGSGASFSANSVSIWGSRRVGLPGAVAGYTTPNLLITPASVTLCTPQSTILTATGGEGYYWEPTGETTNNIVVNPSTSMTYTAHAVLSTGCEVSKTVTVNIGVVATPNITSDQYLICPEIPTATMTLTNGTSYYVGATFQWQKGDCTSNNYTNITNATGYSYSVTQPYGRYRVRVGCGGNVAYSNNIGLFYLPSCSLPPPACNPGGGGCGDCREIADGSIPSEEIEESINAYPNPTSGEFVLSYTSKTDEDATVVIINLLGKEMHKENYNFNKGENNLQLDLSTYPKGMYYVKIIGQNKQLGFKISHQ